MNEEKPRIPSVHPFLDVLGKFVREYPNSEVTQEHALICHEVLSQALKPLPDGDPCQVILPRLVMEKYLGLSEEQR